MTTTLMHPRPAEGPAKSPNLIPRRSLATRLRVSPPFAALLTSLSPSHLLLFLSFIPFICPPTLLFHWAPTVYRYPTRHRSVGTDVSFSSCLVHTPYINHRAGSAVWRISEVQKGSTEHLYAVSVDFQHVWDMNEYDHYH